MDENLSRGYVQLGQRYSHSWVDRVASGRGRRPTALSRQGLGEPPKDPCSCIYLALLLAGVGFLLPYNSFIIAVDYFQGKYPGTTIVFDMSLVYILMAFLAVVVNNLLVETLPLQVRITFGYLLSFATLLFVALFEVCWDIFDHDTGYRANLIAVAIVALGCTVQQSSFYGYTSMLPSRYTQAVMTGESAAGVLVSANRVLTKGLLRDERVNTLLFFSVSVGVVLLCFVVHLLLQRTKFVRFYLALCTPAWAEQAGEAFADDALTKRLEPTEDVGLVDMLDPVESKTGKYGVLSLRTPPASPSSTGGGADSAFESSDVLDRCLEDEDDVGAAEDATEDHDSYRRSLWSGRRPHSAAGSSAGSAAGRHNESAGSGVAVGRGVNFRVQDVVVRMRSRTYGRPSRIWSGVKRGVLARAQVARTVWPYMLSIALAYLVTLSLFPGIESEIVSCRLGSWMPVILMALFNAADFLGKVLSSIPYDWSRSQLVWFSVSRVVLVPLMALCAVPGRVPGENSSLHADVWAMVLSVVLGVTNGVFGSVPMIVAPSRVPDDQKELTGNIMTLSYSLGLTTGSGIAYLIEYLIGWTRVPLPCEASIEDVTSVTWSSLNVTFSNWSTVDITSSVTSLPDNLTTLTAAM